MAARCWLRATTANITDCWHNWLQISRAATRFSFGCPYTVYFSNDDIAWLLPSASTAKRRQHLPRKMSPASQLWRALWTRTSISENKLFKWPRFITDVEVEIRHSAKTLHLHILRQFVIRQRLCIFIFSDKFVIRKWLCIFIFSGKFVIRQRLCIFIFSGKFVIRQWLCILIFSGKFVIRQRLCSFIITRL
jgi:hypothetical protein